MKTTLGEVLDRAEKEGKEVVDLTPQRGVCVVRYAHLTREDVKKAFRGWCKSRFLPEDMVEMFWEEFLEKLIQVEIGFKFPGGEG